MPRIPLVEYREILPRKWTASILCWKIIVHTDVSIHAWKCISKRGSVPAAVCDTFLHFQAPRTKPYWHNAIFFPRVFFFSPSSPSLSSIRFEIGSWIYSAEMNDRFPFFGSNSLKLKRNVLHAPRTNILAIYSCKHCESCNNNWLTFVQIILWQYLIAGKYYPSYLRFCTKKSEEEC